MTVDTQRVKQLTLAKIANQPRMACKRALLIAAAIAACSVLLLGAGKLFDWKVMVDGELRQGMYGDSIIVGDGYAAMSPEPAHSTTANTSTVETVFPDDTPDYAPQPGQLSLFAAMAQDKLSWTKELCVTMDEELAMQRIQSLAEHAEIATYWPQAVDDSYRPVSGFTRFYVKADQLKSAQEVYQSYGEWKHQQVFRLASGYDKNVAGMHYTFASPAEVEVRVDIFNAISDAQVYGGSGSVVMEQLTLDGFDSAVFVRDCGENYVYTWRKIKPVKTIDPLDFGKDTRPADSMINQPVTAPPNVLRWQSLSVSSKDLTKDELLALVKSAAVPGA